ncbi:Mlo-related protein [Dillenia turbinata]|uniref:Mlo-related protein n=1 Tax=Dillenia turbinata TaxID=194707 RepID=A0AAN8UXB2_9MAGN
MLPCKNDAKAYEKSGKDKRKLLSYAAQTLSHRALAAAAEDNYCSKYAWPDKVPMISQSGLHQLHIFIFMLAVFHVLYSVVTMALEQAKMKKWKAWEQETSSLEYQFNNDPLRFRFTHQTSFVRRHSGFSTAPGLRWIVR